jgi:hypothetical protein
MRNRQKERHEDKERNIRERRKRQAGWQTDRHVWVREGNALISLHIFSPPIPIP